MDKRVKSARDVRVMLTLIRPNNSHSSALGIYPVELICLAVSIVIALVVYEHLV